MKFPTIKEMAEDVAEKALDEYEYKGKTLRQWIEFILATDTNVATKVGTDLASLGTDCISREQATDALNKLRESTYAVDYGIVDCDDAINAIAALPPTEPKIIRCKDCKHWIPYDWMFSEVWQSKNIADYPEDDIGCDCSEMAMKANDFCSRAVRREVTT